MRNILTQISKRITVYVQYRPRPPHSQNSTVNRAKEVLKYSQTSLIKDVESSSDMPGENPVPTGMEAGWAP
jgi:hypothetical protein